jgi:hypothetical protein
MKTLAAALMSILVLGVLTACSESPTGVSDSGVPTLAASPHFIGSLTITKSTTTGLTVTGKAAGLGDEPTDAFLSADSVVAEYTCINRGGNIAPGQPLVVDNVEGPTQTIAPHNGQITFTVTLPAPRTPSSSQVCPNGNWRVRLDSLTYFGVVVHIQHGDDDILTRDLGDIDP